MDAARDREGVAVKRHAFAILWGAALAAGVMACSFASLDYLQNGPPEDSGGMQVESEGGGYPSLDAHTTPLATGQTSPNLLAQDSDNLYWISGTDIMTVPKVSGAPRSIGQVSGVLELTADTDPAGAVFVVSDTKVVALQKQSGTQSTVFSVEAGAPAPTSILVDDSSLFVVQVDETDVTTATIAKVPKTGGAPMTIASNSDYPPATVTLTASDVVWGADQSAQLGAFFQFAKASPDASTMLMVDNGSFPMPTSSRGLAANDTTIFWTDGAYLYFRDRQPSSASTDLYDSQDTDVFPGIAIDGANLYTLNLLDNSVMRVSLDGKQNVRLVENLTNPTSLVVDATSVYVSVGPAAAGQILKIDK